jgi:hypothetical protein
MKNNKIIKIIIIVLVSIIALVAIYFGMKYATHEENPEVIEYCSNEEPVNKEGTNYEHNNINYILDIKGNRINTSEKINLRHENFEFRGSKPGLIIENAQIISYKCDEGRAHITGTITNNTGIDLKDMKLYVKIINENEEELDFFFVDTEDIKNGESKELDVATYTRIIDAYDFKFTYYVQSAYTDDEEQP